MSGLQPSLHAYVSVAVIDYFDKTILHSHCILHSMSYLPTKRNRVHFQKKETSVLSTRRRREIIVQLFECATILILN